MKAKKTLTPEQIAEKMQKKINGMSALSIFIHILKGKLGDVYYDTAVKFGLFQKLTPQRMLNLCIKHKNEKYAAIAIEKGAWVINKMEQKKARLETLAKEVAFLETFTTTSEITCDKSYENYPGETTELMVASDSGDEQKVSELIESNSFVNAKNRSGMTAFLYAASKGHMPIIKQLIDAGANPEVYNKEHRGFRRLSTSEVCNEIEKYLKDKESALRAEHKARELPKIEARINTYISQKSWESAFWLAKRNNLTKYLIKGKEAIQSYKIKDDQLREINSRTYDGRKSDYVYLKAELDDKFIPKSAA